MAQNNRDYKPNAGESICSYSRLKNTYGNVSSSSLQVPTMASYTVPEYLPNNQNGPSYPPKINTLSHGQDFVCGGYFNMKGAYPFANCDSCNVNYVSRPCNGFLSTEKYRYRRR